MCKAYLQWWRYEHFYPPLLAANVQLKQHVVSHTHTCACALIGVSFTYKLVVQQQSSEVSTR